MKPKPRLPDRFCSHNMMMDSFEGDLDKRHEDTGGEEKTICSSDIDGNELSNADVEEDDDISEDRETIDSPAETEAVNHIVTPSAALRCHQETLLLTTLLPIMLFIIQR